MRRLFWLALLSVCTSCSAPSDNGENGPAEDAPADTSRAADVAPVSDGIEPSDAVQPTNVVESTDTDGPSDPRQPADLVDPVDTSDATKPADTEVASIADRPSDTAQPRAALADAPPVLGVVAEKPAEGLFVKTDGGYMVPYTMKIPGTDVEFEMVPVPGGTFTMGSPDSEKDRGEGEGPQFQVEVSPFWMGKYEVTWAEYKEYMKLVDTFIDFTSYKTRKVTDENRCDAISAPSNLYDPSMTFANGEEPRQPAVTMTAYAAKQYTKWLSKLTEQFHRLPTEAEWEYACRAGSETTYPFGDDAGDLGDHAWYADNSDETTHVVGEKKPNAWGLYDMIGNVAELVLDEYREDGYQPFEENTVTVSEAIAWPEGYDNRVFRGGSWDDFEEDCRSATRRATEGDDWKIEDPNEPKSPWWYSDEPSLCVGFRVVRPLFPPTEEEQNKTWDPAVEDVLDSAQHRISEGRGSWGLVDPSLPEAIEKLKKKKAGS